MKLPIRVSENSKEPIYHQIENQIKTLIVGGQLPPGTLLPSIRVLAGELACSVITTRRAYQNLENEGFIRTIQGKGTFVNELEQEMEATIKIETMQGAFRKAVEQGKQMGCTIDEIRAAFESALKGHE